MGLGDAVNALVLEGSAVDLNALKARPLRGVIGQGFLTKIRGGTTDQKVLVERIKRARDILINGSA